MARAPKPHSRPKVTRQFQVGTLPFREAILEAMAARPDLDGKRDLAKYFGIHGDMRTPFKLLLKELEGEGFIARTRKTIRRTATLPVADRPTALSESSTEPLVPWSAGTNPNINPLASISPNSNHTTGPSNATSRMRGK